MDGMSPTPQSITASVGDGDATLPENQIGIPREELPDYLEESENYVEVVVGEVCNPHKFYVQLKNNVEKLNTLMDAME